MSKSSDLAKNTTILAVGKLSLQIAMFILLPLYTYYLTPSEYGIGDTIIMYMYLLVPMFGLRSDLSVFRYLIDVRNNKDLWSSIVMSSMMNHLPGILLITILAVVLHSFSNIPYVIPTAILAVSTIITDFIQQIIRGVGDNLAFSKANIFAALSILLFAYLLVGLFGMGIPGMLYSLAAANIVAAAYIMANKKIYKYFKLSTIDWSLQRAMLGYSAPLIPGNMLRRAVDISNRTIILVFIGSIANGLYAVAAKYSTILNSAFSIFELSWSESAALHIDSSDKNEFFSRVANTVIRLFGSLSLILIAIMPFVFSILTGEGFEDAYSYAPLIVASVFLNTLVGFYSAVYLAKKKSREVMNTSIIAVVINIAVALALLPALGVYAVLIAPSISFVIVAIVRHYDVKKHVDITYEKILFLKLFLLYALIVYLYFLNSSLSNVLSLFIALATGYSMNKLMISKIFNSGIKRFKQ